MPPALPPDALTALLNRLPKPARHSLFWLRGRPRWLRLTLGVLLVLGGFLGFLPILGFWMIPLGLFVLAEDVPAVRRGLDRLVGWWQRRRLWRKHG